MPEHKYVVQMHLEGSNVPYQTLLDTLTAGDSELVWDREYEVTHGTADDGTERIYAHIPFYSQTDAESEFDTLRGINGMLNAADAGYLHVHECATGGTPEDWDCGANVIVEETV